MDAVWQAASLFERGCQGEVLNFRSVATGDNQEVLCSEENMFSQMVLGYSL